MARKYGYSNFGTTANAMSRRTIDYSKDGRGTFSYDFVADT